MSELMRCFLCHIIIGQPLEIALRVESFLIKSEQGQAKPSIVELWHGMGLAPLGWVPELCGELLGTYKGKILNNM